MSSFDKTTVSQWPVLSQSHHHLVFSRCVWNQIALKVHSVNHQGFHSAADAGRIPDGDLVEGTAEAAADRIFLPVRTYARVYA